MALQGFVESDYLAAKLAALQADSATATDWAGKTTAQLKTFLANVGFTPESHYQAYGWAEGLAPNDLFNAAQYKLAKATDMFNKGLEEGGTAYATVADALAAFESAWDFDPYLHYLQYGSAEGINPSNDFDESAYLASKLADLKADSETATEWADKTVDDVKAAFAAAGLSALGHYQAYGEDEGIAVTEVPADEKVADDGGEEVPGETFTLTDGFDDITGTANNDKIDGMLDGTDDTFSVGDTIDGGAGTDTLRIISDQLSFDAGVADVSNVEVLKYYNKGTVALATVDLDSDGYTSFILDKMGAAGLTVSGMGTETAVTVDDMTANLLTLTYSGVTGSEDSATVTVKDAVTGSGIAAAGIETFNLKMTGAAAVIDTANALGAATAINIEAGDDAADDQDFKNFTTAANAVVTVTGKGDLDLGTLAATIKTVNAADSEGGITATTNGAQTGVTGGKGDDDLTLVTPTAKLEVNTGTGDDIVNIAAFAATAGKIDGTNVKIDGGAGDEDALVVNTANMSTAALVANVGKTTGFEILANNAAVTTLDADDYSGISIFSLLADNTSGSAQTYTLESDDFLQLANSNSVNTMTLNPVLDSGSDVVNLKLSASTVNLTQFGIDASQIETINITSEDLNATAANSNTITTLTVQNNTKINIDGAADFTATTATGTELTIDGSDATGDLTITVVGGNDNITTGSGDDTIVGAGGVDTIDAGAGDDSITGGAGDDILTGGTGQDTFVYATGADGMDTIKDFTAGTGGDIYDTNFPTENDFVVTTVTAAAGTVDLDTSTGGVFVVDGTLRSAITDYTDGAEVIAAISDTGVSIDTAADQALLALTDGGNTYLYEVIEASADTSVDAGEITLVGIWESVTATDLVDANFA